MMRGLKALEFVRTDRMFSRHPNNRRRACSTVNTRKMISDVSERQTNERHGDTTLAKSSMRRRPWDCDIVARLLSQAHPEKAAKFLNMSRDETDWPSH